MNTFLKDEHADNYTLVMESMFDRFNACRIPRLAEATGAAEKGSLITLEYFGRPVTADCEKKRITYDDDGTELSRMDACEVLAYLIGADPEAKLSGELVSFKNTKAAVFEGAFLRSIAPFKTLFDGAEDFLSAGIAAGGEPLPFGDAAVRIMAFERIPLVYVYFEGDDEFPSDINVLFDRNMTMFIHEEDIPTLGEKGLRVIASFRRQK